MCLPYHVLVCRQAEDYNPTPGLVDTPAVCITVQGCVLVSAGLTASLVFQIFIPDRWLSGDGGCT